MTLREWIEGQDITQREAADRLGVHLVTLNRWLHGKLMPSRDALLRIRDASDGAVSADSFLDHPTDAPPARHPDAPASAEKVAAE